MRAAWRGPGREPGTRRTCAEFPRGFDLDLDISGECLPRCGSLTAAVFDDAGSALAESDILFLDTFPPLEAPAFSGQGFAGILEPGRVYSLRYYFGASAFGGGCVPPHGAGWERTFVANTGLNRVALSAALPISEISCF